MAEITAPRIDPDGTHVIPVRMIHKPGEIPNENSSGELRWNRREGLTFRFQTLLTSLFDFPDDSVQASGGAGAVSAISMKPEWHAETSDRSPVRLYATAPKTSTSTTSSWSVEKGSAVASSKTVEGTACYAEVGLHRDNPIAYWYETLPGPRLFSPH